MRPTILYMQIRIFLNATEEMKLKHKYISSHRHCDKCSY